MAAGVMRRVMAERWRMVCTTIVAAVPVSIAVSVTVWSAAYQSWVFVLGVVIGIGLGLLTSAKFWCYLLEDFVVLPQGACGGGK